MFKGRNSRDNKVFKELDLNIRREIVSTIKRRFSGELDTNRGYEMPRNGLSRGSRRELDPLVSSL